MSAPVDHWNAALDQALAWHRAGELQRAADAYAAVLARAPDHPRAHRLMGALLLQANQPRPAARHLRAALAADPHHAEAWEHLALTARDQGDLDTAAHALTRSLALAPSRPTAISHLAWVLLEQGHPDQAEVQARAALAIAPGSVNARTHLGLALTSQGRLEDARAVLDTALSHAPADPSALLARAALDPQDPALQRALTALCTRQDVRHHVHISAHLQLANAHDAVGDTPTAAAHALAAHQLHQAHGPRYDRDRAETLTRNRLAWRAAPTAPSSGPPPLIAIVGMPRSGTSLAQRIVSAAPGALAFGESPALHRIATHIGGPDGADIQHFAPSTEDRRRLRHALFEALPLPDGATTRVTKLPADAGHVWLLHQLVPDAIAIWCHRPALPTFISAWLHDFAHPEPWTHDPDDWHHHWLLRQQERAHWRDQTALVELDYDALTAAPEPTRRWLMRACRLPLPPSTLAPASGPAHRTLAGPRAQSGAISVDDPQRADRWQAHISRTFSSWT